VGGGDLAAVIGRGLRSAVPSLSVSADARELRPKVRSPLRKGGLTSLI